MRCGDLRDGAQHDEKEAALTEFKAILSDSALPQQEKPTIGGST